MKFGMQHVIKNDTFGQIKMKRKYVDNFLRALAKYLDINGYGNGSLHK